MLALEWNPVLPITYKKPSQNLENSTIRFCVGFFFFCPFAFSRAAPTAYEGSRGPVGAVATSLRQSHSNMGSKPSLQTIPQLMAMPDP